MNPYDPLFDSIRRAGRSNAEAIKTHHDFQAGKRGASGNNGRKFEARGCVGPKRRFSSSLEAPPLFKSKVTGKPASTDGTGEYIRDKITAVIRRYKPRAVEIKREARKAKKLAKAA